jgi:hypothetical protein
VLTSDPDSPKGSVPTRGSDALGTWDDDYLTVTMLSAGLAGMLQRRARAAEGLPNEVGLLPAPWRVAFARLWWRSVEQGQPVWENDLDLLQFCTQPFATWPVVLALSTSDLQQSLLDGEDLTDFAVQGSQLARHDVEGEWIENRVHEALRETAAANGETEEQIGHVYAALRRHLIEHAVLADRDLRPLEKAFPAKDSSGQPLVRQLFAIGYHRRPQQGRKDYWLCPGCRNVVASPQALCGTAGCLGGTAVTLTVNPLAVVYEQHRAVRKYIHDPGLVEIRIMDALMVDDLESVVRVVPYPGVDALDVLIEFIRPRPAGGTEVLETWGIDAKDVVSARLLGRGFSWPASPACDRRYLALPTHRASQPGYVSDLEVELDGRVRGVRVIEEKALIAQVKARAKELTA